MLKPRQSRTDQRGMVTTERRLVTLMKSDQYYWMHKISKSFYKIIAIANENADENHIEDFPCMVVYKDNKGNIWAQKLQMFIVSKTPVHIDSMKEYSIELFN